MRVGRRNTRRDFCSITHRIAIPIQARTQWTHSDVWSQLATTPEWSFKIGDRQNKKKRWNSGQRAIWNATHWIDAGRGVICHRGVSDGSDRAIHSDGAIPPGRKCCLLTMQQVWVVIRWVIIYVRGLLALIRQVVLLLSHIGFYHPYYYDFHSASLFFIHNSTIIVEHKVKSSLPISPCHDHEFTLSTVSIHDCLSLFHSEDNMLNSEL